MLTQLSTIKTRLALAEADTTYDTLLTHAIIAVSARFEKQCQRRFGRTVDDSYEFQADTLELAVPCYPIEAVTKFERKVSETAGWVERAGLEFLVRGQCLISLGLPVGNAREQGRVIYTGGYVLPGAAPGPGQTALPADLEDAAVEQVAWWFRNRDNVGLLRRWPQNGTFEQFAQVDLLPEVKNVLGNYLRWLL